MINISEFQAHLDEISQDVGAALSDLLTSQSRAGEICRPQTLIAAMRHGVLNGGKRLRPFLVIESAALFGVGRDVAMPCACSLECLHSYSLIHDDLPAMDDDDMRRGQPSVHRAYDEATAILAGDALLTLAFGILSDPKNGLAPAISNELVGLLARASGAGGMIGGQILDLQASGSAPDESGIRRMQAMKTGALIRYACEAGAVLGAASAGERRNLITFGETLGLAYQLADDLLDVTASSSQLGKTAGKDETQEKGTLVRLHGVERTRSILGDLEQQAHDSLKDFGEGAAMLRQLASFAVGRDH